MNTLTTTPADLVLSLLRAEADDRLAPLRPHSQHSWRWAVGRTMMTWGTRLASPEPGPAAPAGCVGAIPA